jgi:hypothetical protein
MRPHRTLLALASIAGLLGAPLALAEDAAPPDSQPRASRHEWCNQNPEKCEQMKQRRAERREWCQQNPEPCAQQRAEWKERRAELKAKCLADPDNCKEMKQELREQRRLRHDAPSQPAPAQPAQ